MARLGLKPIVRKDNRPVTGGPGDSWTSNSITCTVRSGSFKASDTVYVVVIGGNGNAGAILGPFTWGGGGQTPACSDGVDNDSDGLIDFPADPGCTSASDPDAPAVDR